MTRRVAITGLGMVTPLGTDVPSTWDALIAGRSGAGPITRFDPVQSPVKFACEVKGFDPAQFLDKKEIRRYDLFAQFAIGAAEEIADPGDRLDHIARLAVRAELAAEPADVELHEVAPDVGVVSPDALEDLLLRQDASGVRHEVTEQLELGRREMDGHLGRAHLVRGLVEHEIAGLVDRGGGPAARAHRAAEDRLHSRDELLRTEGLGDVVVGAELQPAEDVALVLPRGEQ